MYHVKITDDAGRIVTESDGEALVLVHYSDAECGVRCAQVADGASNGALLQIVLGLNHMKQKILGKDPMLKVMYALRDELIDSTTEIDVSALKEQLFGGDDDDDP